MKPEHACGDRCRDDAGRRLQRDRTESDVNLYPLTYRWLLPWRRHVCGSHCAPVVSSGPVRLGRRGEATTPGRRR